jgi:flagellar L-ring protein precursor FlgH
MKHVILIFFCLTTVFAWAQSEDDPGSLWSDKAPNLMGGRTAHQVGDILEVIISENSSASFTATTSTSKADSTSVPTPGIPVVGGLFGSLGFSATSATSGSGSTQQAGVLTARMEVVVTQVLPNGNLKIEGVRRVTVNKDLQLVRLTGIVRPDDVQSDDTIPSERIANAEIRTEGKGQIGDRQRQGIFTKILSYLF